MPQSNTPAQAASDEEANIVRVADVLSSSPDSYVEHNDIKPMPRANARAAVEVAHAYVRK